MDRVLFACRHNAGRSQIAAALFNQMADPSRASAISAGTTPAERVHPEVVSVMREVGIDLSEARPRHLTRELAAGTCLLVTMGCQEECPFLPGVEIEDWSIEDPKGMPLSDPLQEAASRLREAAEAKKCWRCGCLHSSLAAIEQAVPIGERPSLLAQEVDLARRRLVEIQYDCLGCEVCYPALAINALGQAGWTVQPDECAAGPSAERAGWPPLAGSYTVLRYQAPVAVCTLTDQDLARGGC